MAALWAELWSRPQAVEWERQAMTRLVARYVAKCARAETARAPVTLQAEVRQLEDRLGLSPMALLRLRWVIVDDDDHQAVGPAPTGPGRPVTDMARYRAAMAERT